MKNLPSILNRPRNERGFALIIILSVIVLLLALVVGFFSRVQNELQSSSTYQSAGTARNLSDYAVNMVMAQIKAGTAGKDTGGNITAWASQPGAIRTYDTSGALKMVYKLYSSPNMFVSSINPASELSAINGWAGSKAFFTDLNEPINSQYPILDPTADGKVQGFSITGAPTESSPSANRAPMPANWLYVLKDGQVVAPSGSGDTASVAGASTNNPIVGRVAFWTDDDSSKININTAGGGPWSEPDISVSVPLIGGNLQYVGRPFSSFMNVPWVYTAQEGAMAMNQPAQFEYQRYPGHPATTYLSAALPDLQLASIYDLAPRLANNGSSQEGRIKVTAPVDVDTDRLYQSVDELVFAKDRTNNTNIDKATLERAKFFLTASSRAPDVNMFNEPKIGLWPINRLPTKRTPFDRVIEFCQKINGDAYYFQRDDPNSPFTDITQARNEDILDYLRTKTSVAVPGFGGSSGILDKYGNQDRNQTLVEIFDYIRSTNPRESSQVTSLGVIDKSYYFSETGAVVPSYETSTQSQGFGRFPTISKVGILFYTVAVNQASADQSQVTRTPVPPAGIRIGLPENNNNNIPPMGSSKVRAILLLEMFIPGQGYDYVFPRCSIEVNGLNTIKWSNDVAMFDKPNGVLTYNQPSEAAQELLWEKGYNSNPWGGRIGMHSTITPFVGPGKRDYVIVKPDDYPFAGIGAATSPDVPCREDDDSAVFDFKGGALHFVIKNQNNQVIQDFNVTIDPAKVPVPFLAPLVGSNDYRKVVDRMQVNPDVPLYGLIKKEDSIRMVAPASGDFRLVAARNKPSSQLFKPHPFYGMQNMAMAHNFMHSMATAVYGAGLGSYARNAVAPTSGPNFDTTTSPVYKFIKNDGTFSYGNAAFLAEAPNMNGVSAGASTAPGDWDHGVGRTSDGPYINYPDEGNVGSVGNTKVPYFGNVDSRGQLGKANFSPNRMMSSAVMLGSLPTQAASGQAWQTLLFRPTDVNRPGAGVPLTGPPFTTAPDYLLLDFFNMPVVEPYAISEPLSTAGKVNMNYQILPYTYIERSTAMQAVLRSEQMLAIPNDQGLKYRDDSNKANSYRYLLNLNQTDGTLKGFADRFAKGDIFRSPSEICSIWLVPQGQSYGAMPLFWNNHQLTADNGKESSYGRIYPRLTTKSNTYTVHYRVQTLKKPKSSANQAQWQEGKDKVQAEYRGSTTIERYIDPNDPNIPDYISAPSPEPLDTFYKFRVLSQKQFNP